MVHDVFAAIRSSITPRRSSHILRRTRHQAASEEWRKCRRGRIITDGSVVHSVFTYYNNRGGYKKGRVPNSAIRAILSKEWCSAAAFQHLFDCLVFREN